MEVPAIDGELKPEKLEEDLKEGGPMINCDLFDTEIVHKIAQVFLPGLATACVDNTTGGLFRNPASVAVDMRKEMVDYLTQRSETFVAESVLLEGGPEAEVSDHPYDLISYFVDDFASSKRNFFSRVSSWLLSERREDKIDDFVQEMELTGFWLLDRREAIAQTLLKNVDFKNTFHCNKKFNTAEDLDEHVFQCGFRTMNCPSEGCNASFCAGQMEKHDSVCPFKILPCEQKCSARLMRREMDRHCITTCPMKLVNCPFYSVGCQNGVPNCMIEQHRSDQLQSHLLYILQVIHKEASVEDLERRLEQLEKVSSPGQLSAAREVRSLTSMVRDLDAKLGPLEVNASNKVSAEDTEASSQAALEQEVKVSDDDTKVSNLEAKPVPAEVNITNKVSEESREVSNLEEKLVPTEDNITNREASNLEVKPVPVEVDITNKDIQDGTKASNLEVKPVPVEVNMTNKVSEEGTEASNLETRPVLVEIDNTKTMVNEKETEASNLEVKSVPADVNMTNKVTQEGTKTSDHEEKPVTVEVNNTNQVGQESTKAMNLEVKPVPNEIKMTNKDSEEGTKASNLEAKPAPNEIKMANKDSEEGTKASNLEAKPAPNEIKMTNKDSEEGTKASNLEAKPAPNEIKMTNKDNEEGTKASNLEVKSAPNEINIINKVSEEGTKDSSLEPKPTSNEVSITNKDSGEGIKASNLEAKSVPVEVNTTNKASKEGADIQIA